MLHKIKFVSELAVANCSGAMEAETISKNGHSSKSQMSRENIFKVVAGLFLALCFIFSGCDKKEDDEDKNEGVIKLLETMTDEDGYYTTKFDYDSQNRITKISEYREGELSYTTTINYNGDEFKITMSHVDYPEDDDEQVFRKTGNIITIVENYEDSDYSRSSTMTITINNDGYITKMVDISSRTDCRSECETSTWNSEYNCTYQGNNMMKMTTVNQYNNNDEIINYTETYDFKYDNNKSPVYHCKTPKWLLSFLYGFGINNNVTEDRLFRTVYDPWDRTTTYKYVYDSDGYPIKCSETSVFKSEDGSVYENDEPYVTMFTYITK